MQSDLSPQQTPAQRSTPPPGASLMSRIGKRRIVNMALSPAGGIVVPSRLRRPQPGPKPGGTSRRRRQTARLAEPVRRINIMRFLSLALCAGIYSVAVTTERAYSQSIESHSAHVGPMGICNPVSERRTEVGCWIITNEKMGKLPATPLY